mgnify:FL=1
MMTPPNPLLAPPPAGPLPPGWPRDTPMAFVDLETTGANPEHDRITEIGIVQIGPDGVSEWSTLVNPGRPIPEFIERLTGISDAMVASAPRFAELAAEVRTRLAGRLFVAHNAGFDYGFLQHEFARVGGALGGAGFVAPVLCTVKLSRRLYPEHDRHNLDALIARHGLVVGARHRALGDARALHQFWQRACVEHTPTTLDAAVTAVMAGPNLPPHLDPRELAELPTQPGLYLFFDADEQLIFVGKAKNLRARVLAHFGRKQASARNRALIERLRRIEALPAGGELGMALREASLIARHSPEFNRAPRLDPRADRAMARAWPHSGPACLIEAPYVHVVDEWCYLGSALGESELSVLVDSAERRFDRTVYRLLHAAAAGFRPLRAYDELVRRV